MPVLDALREQNDVNKEFTLCPGHNINVPCYRGARRPLGDVGLELEIEGRNLPTDAILAGISSSKLNRNWLSIVDGSLRNGGREFVLDGPIYTSELRQMVDGLYERIALNRGVVDNTNRCSTHVHVNVSDLKVNQINSAIMLWVTFQTCLIRWQGIERVANHFCLSTRDEESMLEAWADYLMNGRYPERGYRDNVKYTALNIIPIWTQGSLEFRVGGPPDNPDKVVWWAKICNAIVRYAAENYQNPYDYGHALSEQGPEGVLRAVLEFANLGPVTTENIFKELTSNQDFANECMEDFRDAQFLLYQFPWPDLLPEINKEHVPNPFGEKPKSKVRPLDAQEFEALARMAGPARPIRVRQAPEI